MKVAFRRALTLVLALCLAALPALSAADTYLPDGEVTHVDFTLATALHPEAFPASKAHLADWAAFLRKLDIKGSMDALAMLTPQSRVYLSGALRLNGDAQIPFVYDGYHSYRYFISPALGNEVLFFQMHNFLEFMLKPYYYMELPTQYLGLLMYPEASYYLGDSFYTPVAEALTAAREEAAEQTAATREALLAALDEAQAQTAAELAAATARIAELDAELAAIAAATPTPTPTATPAPTATAATATDTVAPPAVDAATAEAAIAPDAAAPAAETAATSAPDGNAPATDAAATAAAPAATEAPATTAPTAATPAAPDTAALQAQRDALAASIQTLTATQTQLAAAAQGSDSLSVAALQALLPAYAAQGEADEAAPADGEPAADVPEGATVYTVPYERLYELCETLDLLTNDDPDLERVYFYITCLLTQQLASDMVVDTLGRLEDTLDALDPDQNGMTVVETADSMTCTIGDTEVYRMTAEGNVTDIALTLPTADGYDLTFAWRWNPEGSGAALDAKVALVMEGQDSVALSITGTGLPRVGDVSGQGQLSLAVSGTGFETKPQPVTIAFDWARNAKQTPYTLGLTLAWLHPDTGLPALSVDFNGTFTTADKSVFTEGQYPQNDFFNLNETYLNDYKDRLLKPLALKLAPILLEMPAGVINDLYAFAAQNDILVSLVE